MIKLFPQKNFANPLEYKIAYKSSVSKDLKSISKKETEKILTQIDAILSVNPFLYPALKENSKN